MELPRIISVDDHVLEPPDLWESRIPASKRGEALRVTREVGVVHKGTWIPGDSPHARWTDVWRYEDLVWPLQRGYAQSGFEDDDAAKPVTYDEVLPGAFQVDARLAIMDANHTDVSICFPTVPRFCGQTFLERADKELALLSVRAYNDWMIDEWCGGSASKGRLIPMTLVPLWDAELAAQEVRRCAAKGSHAISFSECPPYLGLPSVYSHYWDVMFDACEDTDTVINMHVGSSSTVPKTADDAPPDMELCLIYVNALLGFTDWLYSGVLQEFRALKIALSESQAGWIPFVTQRVDNTWKKSNQKFKNLDTGSRRARELPSSVLPGRVFACIFDDLEGLRNRAQIGVDQIMFETDFPHSDSTFPDSKRVAHDLVTNAGLSDDEIYGFLRGNAIRAYGLDKYFNISQ